MKLLRKNRESLARRASLLNLSARTLAENMRGGAFKSLYRGQGIEFNGVREYLPGDDVRSIDWNVTARMDKPFVKMFEEERELPVFLIVDASLSMQTGASGVTRLEQASETAALLLLAANQTSSPVGIVIFDEKIRHSFAPKSGKDFMMSLLSCLDNQPDKVEAGSALDLALQGAAKLLKKRSLIFVISDFRSTNWEAPIAVLASKHDVVAIRITDSSDSNLPAFGTISFTDTESDLTISLPTSSKKFQTSWRNDNDFRREVWKNYCAAHLCNPLVISTEDDSLRILLEFFSKRESRK